MPATGRRAARGNPWSHEIKFDGHPQPQLFLIWRQVLDLRTVLAPLSSRQIQDPDGGRDGDHQDQARPEKVLMIAHAGHPWGRRDLSATAAPRWPAGAGGPVVVSAEVCCSSSEFSSAPSSTTASESQIQVMNPTTAPSDP